MLAVRQHVLDSPTGQDDAVLRAVGRAVAQRGLETGLHPGAVLGVHGLEEVGVLGGVRAGVGVEDVVQLLRPGQGLKLMIQLPRALLGDALGLPQSRQAALQLVLQVELVRQVPGNAQHPHQPPLGIAHGRLDRLQMLFVAVAGEAQGFDEHLGAIGGDGGLVVQAKESSPLRRHEVVVGLAHDVGLGRAVQGFKACVAGQVDAIRVLDPDQIRQSLNQASEEVGQRGTNRIDIGIGHEASWRLRAGAGRAPVPPYPANRSLATWARPTSPGL